MSKNPYVLALMSALITAGLIKAAPALAETPSAGTETQVSYVRTADLDLTSQTGRHQLEQRIAQAARQVCGTPSDSDLVGVNKARECRREAIAQASSRRDVLLVAANRGAVIAVIAAR